MALSYIEAKLLAEGFEAMSPSEQNNLINFLATKFSIPITSVTNDYILNYHKQLKLDDLWTDCEDTVISGFTSSNGNSYQLSTDDRINMLAQKSMLDLDSTITTVSWKTLNNGMVDHTKDDWLSKVFIEGFKFAQGKIMQYETLADSVNQATSGTDIVKIVWS